MVIFLILRVSASPREPFITANEGENLTQSRRED